jgi:hypothetical protein
MVMGMVEQLVHKVQFWFGECPGIGQNLLLEKKLPLRLRYTLKPER